MTTEEVLCRENVLAAYQRVVSNQGAPGVDGTTVDELMPMLHERWRVIREELLNGRYKPSPVRQVHIPKAGGIKRPKARRKGVVCLRYCPTSCSMIWTRN